MSYPWSVRHCWKRQHGWRDRVAPRRNSGENLTPRMANSNRAKGAAFADSLPTSRRAMKTLFALILLSSATSILIADGRQRR